MPYFVAFGGSRDFSSEMPISQIRAKIQESSENLKQSPTLIGEIQKADNTPTQIQLIKIQTKIFLQKEKPIAALSSPEIHNSNTQPDKDQAFSEQLQTPVNTSRISQIRSPKTIKIKINKFPKEEEYQPFQKKRRQQTTVRQNENRNIIPNEVNQIFSYIQKSLKSNFVVSRIFKKYPPPSNQDFTIKKFYLYQSLLKEKISNYINETSLSLVTELYEPRCEVYSEQQQRYYNKVCRVLIHHFLQEDSIFNILTSRRMHKDKKRNHLEMRRVLKSKVLDILRS